MTAPAYAPTLPSPPVLPWRSKPAYRGPLVVIPGGRAASRRTSDRRAAAPWGALPERRPTLAAISAESADAAREFQRRLSSLPLRPEIRLDRQRRSVRVDGSARHLTPREFDLLAALAAQPGEPIRREVLLRLGADERDRELGEGSRTVDVHVAHVREKLGLPGVIATIRGRGYALNPAFPVEIA